MKWQTNALKKLRAALTFDGTHSASQTQVARAIKVGLNRYFLLEQGEVDATPREARELARLFNVDERELLLDIRASNRVAVRKIRRAS